MIGAKATTPSPTESQHCTQGVTFNKYEGFVGNFIYYFLKLLFSVLIFNSQQSTHIIDRLLDLVNCRGYHTHRRNAGVQHLH
jgi:hypothetical protein